MAIPAQPTDQPTTETISRAAPRAPQVSIGMPVYNGERFIRDALDSLLAQTFTDFELIISDNASTDETESICRDYLAADPRIRYFKHQINNGAGANFQFVLDEAVGKYFMWAAADDLWNKTWLEDTYNVSSKRAAPAFGLVQYIDEFGSALSNTANMKTYKFSGPPLIRRLSYFTTTRGKACAVYGLFPRAILDRNSLRDLFDRPGGDKLFLYSLLSKAPLYSVDSALMKKRLHPGRASFRQPETRRGLWRAISGNSLALLRSAQLLGFMRVSKFYEKPLIAFLYPVHVGLTFVERLRFLLLLRKK